MFRKMGSFQYVDGVKVDILSGPGVIDMLGDVLEGIGYPMSFKLSTVPMRKVIGIDEIIKQLSQLTNLVDILSEYIDPMTYVVLDGTKLLSIDARINIAIKTRTINYIGKVVDNLLVGSEVRDIEVSILREIFPDIEPDRIAEEVNEYMDFQAYIPFDSWVKKYGINLKPVKSIDRSKFNYGWTMGYDNQIHPGLWIANSVAFFIGEKPWEHPGLRTIFKEKE